MSGSAPVCLDTRVLSHYLRGKEKARQIVEQYQNIYTTTINVAEFYMGYYKVRKILDETEEEIRNFFMTLRPRMLDYEAARLAGQLYAGPLKAEPIGWRDTFIAAICLNNGETIVTNNVRHFKRVPKLDVIEY